MVVPGGGVAPTAVVSAVSRWRWGTTQDHAKESEVRNFVTATIFNYLLMAVVKPAVVVGIKFF